MHRLAYIGFRMGVGLFSLLPFFLVYLLSDMLRFFLQHIFKYRVDVIKKNLDYCFPDLSIERKKEIKSAFYKNFVDIILESFKGLATNPDKLIPRYKLRNPEILESVYSDKNHIIAYSQHYNNWEWAPICLGLQMDHHLVGIVKLIANNFINEYMIEGRSGNNVSVIPTYNTGSFFRKLNEKKVIPEKPQAVVFIADQRPSGKEKYLELPFLGAEVARFHKGAGNYASESGLPIYSIDVHRVGRGRYEIEITALAEGSLSADEITLLYKQNLENLIKKSPESWLWSHKRFKEYIDY